jgi:hypothetical protein
VLFHIPFFNDSMMLALGGVLLFFFEEGTEDQKGNAIAHRSGNII